MFLLPSSGPLDLCSPNLELVLLSDKLAANLDVRFSQPYLLARCLPTALFKNNRQQKPVNSAIVISKRINSRTHRGIKVLLSYLSAGE